MDEKLVTLQTWIEIHERLASIEANQRNQNGKLDEILIQAKTTNGRVGTLENWKSTLTGKVSAISIMWSALVAIAGLLVHLIIKK